MFVLILVACVAGGLRSVVWWCVCGADSRLGYVTG